MIDTLTHFLPMAEKSGVHKKFGINPGEYALVTLHRAENTDNPERFRGLINALREINSFIKVILPLHPRTEKIAESLGIKWDGIEAPLAIPAQPYLDFLKLESGAKFVITDSGGVQEETSVLGIPCITVRTETERPSTCEYGTSEVVGVESEKIIAAAKRASAGDWKKGSAIPLWDGHAAERIMEIIAKYLRV